MNTGVWGDGCMLTLLALIFPPSWLLRGAGLASTCGASKPEAKELEEEVLGATVEGGNSDCPRLWSQCLEFTSWLSS